MPEVEPFKRLPKHVIPQNYKVFLQPNLTKCTFKGAVEIDIEIKEPSKFIELNCLDLTLSDILIVKNDTIIKPSSHELHPSIETLHLLFNEALLPGEAVLKISFEGVLNDKLKGFYRSKYNIGPETRYGAVTQFEATDARRCFPCWDEPAIKATFDVILTVPCNRVALSNMNETSRVPHETDSSLQVLTFARTPVMSSYLLAVVVGEYDHVEEVLAGGVVVRIYTPVGKKDQGLFALEVAAKVLPYYKEYFQIDYPLPKMDLIAISDFSVGTSSVRRHRRAR
ncbi:UNVERIFIED_CONTAM: hypothetical protein GTU68_005811 [Idotea baltica]|nr:hypothetical protein [Idotea baltica]